MIDRPRFTRLFLLACIGVILAFAIPAGAGAAQTQKATLNFAAVAGTQNVSCSKTITGLGMSKADAKLKDLRFYVTAVRFIRSDGKTVALKLSGNKQFQTTWKKQPVSLIDLENGKGACSDGTKGTNSAVTGTLPRGSYKGVQFSIGVPKSINHTDLVTSPAPLNLASMGWSWQYGRKFAKIEFADPGGSTGTWAQHAFVVHLGSTGCTGDPETGGIARCSAINMPDVKLKRFNAAKQVVAVDIKKLVAGNDLTNAGPMAMAPMMMDSGCMSEPTLAICGPIFKAFGLNWKADGSGTGRATGKQSVFRAIAR